MTDVARPPATAGPMRGRLLSVAALFLRLGATAIGGPAVYIAMFRDEVVGRRQWLTDNEFLDLLGATNLIPGPNATEMAVHIGRVRAGWAGLVLAGICFTAPATAIALVFAWAYVRFGSTPELSWALYGIKPIVIGVIVYAIWNIAKATRRDPILPVAGVAVLVLYLRGFNEIALLFAAGGAVAFASNAGRLRLPRAAAALAFVKSPAGLLLALGGAGAAAATSYSTPQLFLTFLKIGAVLYGSGYVIVTLLRAEFVNRLHWLTEQQLLDAVAAGQVTPGPLLSTATFIGYVLGGWQAALLATLAVFLPSFVFVAATGPLIPHVRRSAWTSSLLDGVSVAALALMAGVTWQVGSAAIVDVQTALIAVVGTVLLIMFRVNTSWLVLLGGLAGLALKFAG